MLHNAGSINVSMGIGEVNLFDIEINEQIYSDVTVCVKNVSISNNSIGHYEFGGTEYFDIQCDHVDDFECEAILIEDKEVTSELFKAIEADKDTMERVRCALGGLL